MQSVDDMASFSVAQYPAFVVGGQSIARETLATNRGGPIAILVVSDNDIDSFVEATLVGRKQDGRRAAAAAKVSMRRADP